MNIPRADPLVSKTDIVRQALIEGRDLDALRVAHTFRHLGDHKVTIQRGWDAHANPRFARSLGRDPDQLYADAIAALRLFYNL